MSFDSLSDSPTAFTRHKSMGSGPIWPDIPIILSVIFEEILVFKRVRHIVSCKGVIVQTVVIRKIKN